MTADVYATPFMRAHARERRIETERERQRELLFVGKVASFWYAFKQNY